MRDLEAHLAQYREQGFTVIPGLLAGPTLDGMLEATDALLDGARHTDVETDVLELEPGHTRGAPRVRRVKTPHRAHPIFWDTARSNALMQAVTALIGPDVRLSHSKINTKRGTGGAAIEWHQDWAFAPHTYMGMCIVSVMLDACTLENGPLQVVPGSHRGKLYEHHDDDGFFAGAIEVARWQVPVERAVPLVGPAGSVAIHHPLTVHGSSANRSGAARRMLFLEYAAADAWPLFYGPVWDEYMSRMVAGGGTSVIRTEPVFIKQPFPTRAPGSIFESQTQFAKPYFDNQAA